jgi:hypothetical protein
MNPAVVEAVRRLLASVEEDESRSGGLLSRLTLRRAAEASAALERDARRPAGTTRRDQGRRL